MRKALFIAVLIPFVGSCASLSAAPPALTPVQASLVDATCLQIMGLHRGEYYYQMCQESLGNSLAAKSAGEQTARAWDDCRDHGMDPGSAAHSACVLEQENSTPPAAKVEASPVKLVYPHDELQSDKSYYRVTNGIIWKRQQYSCAQLGLEPGSSAFAHCVASLDAALLPPN